MPLDGRVEVVPTRRHWETVYVASEVPLARGWERQLDIGRNAIFYEDDLDRAGYHRWLLDNAVRYVALADVALDPSAGAEADLVRGRPAYLEAVWRNEHWVLFRVVDARPLVEGPARLVRSGPADVVLDVTGPGPVLVRVRWSSHWSLDAAGLRRREPRRVDRAAVDVTGPGDAAPGAGAQPADHRIARRLPGLTRDRSIGDSGARNRA